MAIPRRSSLPAPALALATLAACSGASEPPGWDDQGDLANPTSMFPPAASAGEGASDAVDGVDSSEHGSPDPRAGDKEILPLSGRLQGYMAGVEFDDEGTSNMGESLDWPDGGSLVLRVTVQSEARAGMLLLTLEGGPDHPLLTEGRWTSEQQSASDPLDRQAPKAWVKSCAGPDLGECDWMRPPLGYELTATTDPDDPERVRIEANVTLQYDEQITATMSFVEPR